MKNKYFSFISALILSVSAGKAQSYCSLPGRMPYAPEQPGIRMFKLNKVTRTSSNVESMSSVVVTTNLTDSVVATKVYTVTINHNRDSISFLNGLNNIRVFIDYNQDWDYNDPGETVVKGDFQAPGVFTATFAVPANATPGITGLRASAKMSENVGHTAITPCDNPADPLGYHGEMEDYWLYIAPAPNLVGLKEENTNFTTVVSPNPATQQLNLNIESTADAKLGAELFDITGRNVKSLMSPTVISSGSHHFNFDLNCINGGIYFVKISNGSAVHYQKVVIEK